MAKNESNDNKKPYTFLLHFVSDGHEEEVTILSDSYHSAVYGLPKFADVGRYKYTHKRSATKTSTE